MIQTVSRRLTVKALDGALRQYRTDQAYIRAIPAMNVFNDGVLKGIVAARPTTLKQLEAVRGIGPRRRAAYGADIVRLVNSMKGKGKTSQFFQEKPAPKPAREPRPAPPKPARQDKTDVYILELEQGRVYVGSSKDVKRRVEQHTRGAGAAYTRAYKPTGVQLPRLGNVDGDGDAAERDETLRYMMLRGISYVRGWRYSQVVMPASDFKDAEANIRELFNLCRRCGYQGHFMTQCRANFDRWGEDLRREGGC